MKKWIIENTLHPFLRTWQENRWFGAFISAVVITMFINLIYDVVKEVGGLVGAGIMIVSILLLIIVYVTIDNSIRHKRRRKLVAHVSDKPNPSFYKGVIIMLSKPDTAWEAINYHKEKLTHCWIVTTPEKLADADDFKAKLKDRGIEGIVRLIKDRYDTRGCYDLVRDIFNNESIRLGIEPHDVIADITGGTKPMTVAMLLASLEGEYALEHIPAEYDQVTDKPIGPLPPIQISVDLPPWSSVGTNDAQ